MSPSAAPSPAEFGSIDDLAQFSASHGAEPVGAADAGRATEHLP